MFVILLYFQIKGREHNVLAPLPLGLRPSTRVLDPPPPPLDGVVLDPRSSITDPDPGPSQAPFGSRSISISRGQKINKQDIFFPPKNSINLS